MQNKNYTTSLAGGDSDLTLSWYKTPQHTIWSTNGNSQKACNDTAEEIALLRINYNTCCNDTAEKIALLRIN